MGEVTVSERKHRFVIVFVKYYCSDFILTIVFLFSAGFFLGWGLKVCVFFVCFCVLLFECNARFFVICFV